MVSVGAVVAGVAGAVDVSPGVVAVSSGASRSAPLIATPKGSSLAAGSDGRLSPWSRSVGAPPSSVARSAVSAGRPVGIETDGTPLATVPFSPGWIGR